MKNLLTLAALLLLFSGHVFSQNVMVLHRSSGAKIQLPLEAIDSIRFTGQTPVLIQQIYRTDGTVLSLQTSEIDSITWLLPDTQDLPKVNTLQVTAASSAAMNAQGMVLNEGSSAVTQRGFCWSLQPMPSIADNISIIGSGPGNFSGSIGPMTASTPYYIRAWASNSSGTAYGTQVLVSTLPASTGNLATVITDTMTLVLGKKAIGTGRVTANGGLAVTARGLCWSADSLPTINGPHSLEGSGTGVFRSFISNLLPNNNYKIRAYAVNGAGIAYGNTLTFTTSSFSHLVSDIDGNEYEADTVGTQIWMTENLKASRYNNGDSITGNLSLIDWMNFTEGAYAVFQDVAVNNTIYGKLYNWYAVNDPRRICPAGWHIPSDHEWKILIQSIDPGADTTCQMCNSSTLAGAALKAVSSLWNSENIGATNASGFTGLPGGVRYQGGGFFNLGVTGEWWSSAEYGSGFAIGFGLINGTTGVSRDQLPQKYGNSVRCLKD